VPGATLSAVPHGHAPLVSVRTQHGGHVAFVAGTPLRPHFWFEPLIARFLTDALAASPSRSA